MRSGLRDDSPLPDMLEEMSIAVTASLDLRNHLDREISIHTPLPIALCERTAG